MSPRASLANVDKVKSLAERLRECPEVRRFDDGDEQEAWTLAHSFADLEESFRKFVDEQLPRLTKDGLEDAALLDLLLEIGEEFRHVLYHINDPKFYRYLHGSE